MPLFVQAGSAVASTLTPEELAYQAKLDKLKIDQKKLADLKHALISARNAKGNLGFNPHYGRG